MYGKRDSKKEEEDLSLVFSRLNKTNVLQDARQFNETPVNTRKCGLILTKILYLLNQGAETLSTQEATDCFFNLTKLFQSKDTTLRRLVYIGIKELSQTAENVYVVTSSLTTDMNSTRDDPAVRSAAMRALTAITDPTTFQGIERFMKQAIVDRAPCVASASLVSSLHLARTLPDGVKRWVNEAQEAVNSDSPMVQHHALGLLYHIRRADRLSVSKMVSKYIRGGLKSPYAICVLIRIAARLCEEEVAANSGNETPYFSFVESCLRHKSEMVVYEAANAIVYLRADSPRDLAPAVSVLQLFLSSPKPTLRFAAVRTLNKIAITAPQAVTACNVDLDNLITDSNRSIATLAITTLLKTGSETSVERLMKLIGTFMSEISDEFKIVVVEATRALCQKFPRKHDVMMASLADMLREDGGYEYKRAIVDTITYILEDNPEAKESGLSHLCEFVEDCEHISLAVRILHLLGKEGPRSRAASKYVRIIYKRLSLETPPVRAAAVSALAKFGAAREDLLPSILVLLRRCLMDGDDEVRDRATYYLHMLDDTAAATALPKSTQQGLITGGGLQVSLVGLEKALLAYLADGRPAVAERSAPFDIKTVPLATVQPFSSQGDHYHRKPTTNGIGHANHGAGGGGGPLSNAIHKGDTKASSGQGTGGKGTTPDKMAASRQDIFAEQLAAVPELAALQMGPILKSSLPVELTESETEYVVQCVKHIFQNHVVLQFDSTNTLNDQILESVRVSLNVPEGFEIAATIPCPRLAYNIPATTYVCLRLTDPYCDLGLLAATFDNVILKYLVRDCDPTTGEVLDDEGYDDEYVLEDIDLTIADYMQRVAKANFATCWDELGPETEAEETYGLSNFKTIDEAMRNIITFMGMQPAERSDKVPEGKSAHTLYMAGVFRGRDEVLARAKLAVSPNVEGVTMKLTSRSANPEVAAFIASAVV